MKVVTSGTRKSRHTKYPNKEGKLSCPDFSLGLSGIWNSLSQCRKSCDWLVGWSWRWHGKKMKGQVGTWEQEQSSVTGGRSRSLSWNDPWSTWNLKSQNWTCWNTRSYPTVQLNTGRNLSWSISTSWPVGLFKKKGNHLKGNHHCYCCCKKEAVSVYSRIIC